MVDEYKILSKLSNEQKNVIISKDNILLTACPGSGKTRTLTHKLAYETAINSLSHKLNIAITYTNRAANEIYNRLDDMEIDSATVWTGTIHQFCMKFIIRPYAMYSERLKKGYYIIDEYTKEKYGKSIAQELKIKMERYDDPFLNKDVVNAYEKLLEVNKEIDFDMILKFSHLLLEANPFICENISSIINCLLIDEFQDTNEFQYLILSKIYNANKKIQLLFVGDVNQAIFGTLGGKAKNKNELDILYNTYFKPYSLTGCYRSTQQIVNLYRNFEIQATGVNSVSDIKDETSIISHNTSISNDKLTDELAEIIQLELANGTKEEEICIIAPQWFDLFKLSKELREKLPFTSFDAPNISPIKYDPLNPLYLIAQLLFMPEGRNVTLKKKIANELLSIFKDDLKINISDNILNYDIISTINRCRYKENDGILCFKYAIEQVYLLLQINIQTEQVLLEIQNQIFDKINNRVEKYDLKTDCETMNKYFGEKRGIVLSTIHGVKGEEYTTVIAISLLNGKLPHWDIICNYDNNFRMLETKTLLYVLCSRAKKNIYLFSENGYRTRSGKPYTPTNELSFIDWENL